MKLDAVDAVVGLDVDGTLIGLPQDPFHWGRNHAMSRGIAKDNHAPAYDGIAHKITGIDAAHSDGGRDSLTGVVSNFARRNLDHDEQSSFYYGLLRGSRKISFTPCYSRAQQFR